MSVAIELFGAVYTTAGGTRYHADRACYALANGRSTQAYRAGEGAYGESWYGAQHLDGLYPLERRSVISAVRYAYTACLVCVPAVNALPFPIGETYGHEPVTGAYSGVTSCVRCTCAVAFQIGDPWVNDGWVTERMPAPWPCTSAVVLGLHIADADRWNQRYPIGTLVTAYPATRTDEPLRTRTRTPAWRLHSGDSLVSVDGYAGGICLTHIDPRGGA